MRIEMEKKHVMWHAKMLAAGIKWEHAKTEMNIAKETLTKYTGLYTSWNTKYHSTCTMVTSWKSKMSIMEKKSKDAHSLFKVRTTNMKIEEERMIEASEAQARAEERMKIAIKESEGWKSKMTISIREMNAQKVLYDASLLERTTMLNKYMHAKGLMIKAKGKLAESTNCRICAEAAAKKRLHVQAIYLTKWMLSFKVKQTAMHLKMSHSKQLALVYHQKWESVCKLLSTTTLTEEKLTHNTIIMLQKKVDAARHRAESEKKVSLEWEAKKTVALARMHHLIRERQMAHEFMMHQRSIQLTHVLKAKAIRLAVHDYISKVRHSHAQRNFLFDTKQCKQMKHTLHGLFGKHSLASRQANMVKARSFWCSAASFRQMQLTHLESGAMVLASSFRGKAIKAEAHARAMHNYVWAPRVDTCKGKCIKYQDWLKIVTALAKAMAMKPCGKIPNAPVNGV